jgi:hypothetical protein
LSGNGRAIVERFARFVHAEEHHWVQARLVGGDDEGPPPAIVQTGPSLFDDLVVAGVGDSSN